MIILAGQNTICQFPVRRVSNFPPDCTLVMTNTAGIQTASQLRLEAAVETWSSVAEVAERIVIFLGLSC